METRLVQCQNCGAELDFLTNQCPYCAPAADALKPEAPSVPVAAEAPAAPSPALVEDRDRSLGLSLFEAEEALARGAADKAVVLASKAVKERPDSLTARALLDRARRELLRGRRREKLEARLKEAQGLMERGEPAAAERIVSSALKLIPDHPLALELFGRLKERRLQAGTAEAEAERELMTLARTQARQALQAARTALAAGWARKAVLALRRGLLLVPDDPDLLALLREVQQAGGGLDAERSRRHALVRQVRAGLELLAQGQIDASLKILRAVLREDPDNARAQAAIQELRRTWLAAQPAPPHRVERPAPPAPAPLAPPRPAPAVVAAPHRPEPPPMPVRPAIAPTPPPKPVAGPDRPAPARAPLTRPTPAPTPSRVTPTPSRSAIPAEILLPRTRRRGTPLGLILGAGVLVVVVVVVLAGRTGSGPPAPAPLPTQAAALASAPAATRPAPPAPRPPGPLDAVDAELRRAIESTLADYARALERGDPALLEKARPDMGPTQREARVAPFVGALNAATDLRVLDVDVRGDQARISILATDVIVGGRGGARAPREETLDFERRGGGWALRGERR